MVEDEEENNNNKANLDWNKKGFDSGERLTLKINVHEANQYQAEKGKKKIGVLPKNIRKLNKKVLDSRDEDEEEDGIDEDVLRALRELQINTSDASNGDNSLLNALSPEERRFINQNTTIEIARHEQNAGKMNALLTSNKLSHQAGLNSMSAGQFVEHMQNAVYNPRLLKEKSFVSNVAKKTGMKGKMTNHRVDDLVKGVKVINKTTGDRKVPTMKIEDAQKVGRQKMSQNATAELILKKSGQTARLTAIKERGSYKNPENYTEKKPSYSKEVKDLLRDSLRKNNKVHE